MHGIEIDHFVGSFREICTIVILFSLGMNMGEIDPGNME
jgi:hypothetical protein